jgi:hypothetical protein
VKKLSGRNRMFIVFAGLYTTGVIIFAISFFLVKELHLVFAFFCCYFLFSIADSLCVWHGKGYRLGN